MVVLGGMGSIWGVVVVGTILSWLNFEGLANIGRYLNDNTPLDFEVPRYQAGIYGGALIVLMMLFRPQGLIPERRASGSSRRASTTRASYKREIADLLVADHVRKEFGGLVAVNDVDFG